MSSPDSETCSLVVETAAPDNATNEGHRLRRPLKERIAQARATWFKGSMTWSDDYFDNHLPNLNVVAVFDHDPTAFACTKRSILGIQLLLVFATFGLALILNPFWNWLLGEEGFNTVTGLMIIILWKNIIISAIVTCRSTRPHTAVTSDGVAHVDENRVTYLFPFGDIVDIPPYEESKHSFPLFKLANGVRTYEQQIGRCSRTLQLMSITLPDSTCEYGMARPKYSGAFRQMVLKLKKMKDDGLLQDEEANQPCLVNGGSTVYISKIPHTAVTTKGVMHVDENRFAHFFPFEDIIKISPSTPLLVKMKLEKGMENYRQGPKWKIGSDMRQDYSMASPIHSKLLSQLVPKLKELQQEGPLDDDEANRPLIDIRLRGAVTDGV